MGLVQAKFRVVAAVENDPLALATYRQNHPKVRLLPCNIRAVDPVRLMRQLKLRPGELDLLTGCPPCQGFSTVRTLNGKRVSGEKRNDLDGRNDLVFEIVRFAGVFKPKAVLLENVPALARDPRIDEVQDALRDLGYDPDLRVLDAADYGVPQRRRRMILTAGMHGKIPLPDKVVPQQNVGDAIRGLAMPGASGDPLHDLSQMHSPRIQKLIAMIPKDGGGLRQMGEEFQLLTIAIARTRTRSQSGYNPGIEGFACSQMRVACTRPCHHHSRLSGGTANLRFSASDLPPPAPGPVRSC